MPANNKNDQHRGINLSGSEGASHARGRSWFLGIGINRYQHFRNLNNAVKDVKDMMILLQDDYDLESENALALFDEQATRNNIISTLDQLVEEIEPIDRLLIYYSGHGHLNPKTNKGYWIPHDAEKDNTAHYIRNATIMGYLEDISSLHTLLISDSCFSGSLFVRGAQRSAMAFEELEKRKSRWAICSGRHDEEVSDGNPGVNSPFAASILDVLRTNQLPRLNVAKLADRVVELTRANYKQLPEGNPLYGVGHNGGQYVFHLRTNEDEDWALCLKKDALDEYRAFLQRYPKGSYGKEAWIRIAHLEEDNVWLNAQRENTIQSYRQYERQYPEGRYTENVLKAIRAIDEEEDWKEASLMDSLLTYRDYLRLHPEGKNATKARERIAELEKQQDEPKIWRQVVSSNTIAAYKGYLEIYPNGLYAEEVKARIKALKSGASIGYRPKRVYPRATSFQKGPVIWLGASVLVYLTSLLASRGLDLDLVSPSLGIVGLLFFWGLFMFLRPSRVSYDVEYPLLVAGLAYFFDRMASLVILLISYGDYLPSVYKCFWGSPVPSSLRLLDNALNLAILVALTLILRAKWEKLTPNALIVFWGLAGAWGLVVVSFILSLFL